MKSLALSLVLATLALAADPLAASARKKLDDMTEERLKPRTSVFWSLAELNAWVREETPEQLPPGVTNTRVELGDGIIDAFATVDFLKIAEADGKPVNSIIAKLIEGERPLKLTLRVESTNGRMTINLTRLELSGLPVAGPPLALLLQAFFLSYHPSAHINEPFDLPYNLRKVEVTPRGIRAYR
jgi:hypothetical protein